MWITSNILFRVNSVNTKVGAYGLNINRTEMKLIWSDGMFQYLLSICSRSARDVCCGMSSAALGVSVSRRHIKASIVYLILMSFLSLNCWNLILNVCWRYFARDTDSSTLFYFSLSLKTFRWTVFTCFIIFPGTKRLLKCATKKCFFF